MSSETMAEFAPLLAAAERILSAKLGRPIQVTAVERLSEPERRNLLLRCLTSPSDDLPASFILKQRRFLYILHLDNLPYFITDKVTND